MTKIKTHKLFPTPIFEFKIQNHESLNSELDFMFLKVAFKNIFNLCI